MSAGMRPESLLDRLPATRSPWPIWRLTVDDYHQMIDAGILTEDDPVELLEGWLVPKMPKKPPHRLAKRKISKALEGVLPAGWHVETQEPITLEDSEPEPDVLVVRGDPFEFTDRHPGPEDLGLVVEIADASLKRDRTLKKRVYARAGIPIYWIVNLPGVKVETYMDPLKSAGEAKYRRRQTYQASASVPLILDGREVARIPVRDLLP